jgi:hypothetical protein
VFSLYAVAMRGRVTSPTVWPSGSTTWARNASSKVSILVRHQLLDGDQRATAPALGPSAWRRRPRALPDGVNLEAWR